MEKYQFSAEIGKVLQLMIHSLYTNKDIFLRELISNASDACDKLRYLAIAEPSLLEEGTELKIQVTTDDQNLYIRDNGIGMDKDDLIKCLGTIASSGTQKFLEAVSSQQKSNLELIGQFGVGFYSAFMVADEVEVISRKAGTTQAYIWKSIGTGEFELDKYEGEAPVGTEIKLKIKASEVGYLDKFRLKHIITTYSDHISFPIEVVDDGHVDIVNTASALWTRSKNEITEEEYNEFYHHVSHLPDTPWLKLHTRAEGAISYTSLLYIPSMKPFDLFHPDRKTRVKLYIKKVFITEDSNLIPAYLRFLRGVVDSEDLPLNISRESFQHTLLLEKIKKSIVKKILGELKTKSKDSPEEYVKFWNNFGEVMKEGLCEQMLEEKEQLLEVCKFRSTGVEGFTTIDEYMDRMLDNQEHIFYITGDKAEALMTHPQLEGFRKRGIEVLLLSDHVDDFWVNTINLFKNKELLNVNSSKIDLDKIKHIADNDNKGDEKPQASAEKLLSYIKGILKDYVKDVVVSCKLVDSPACLSVPLGSMSIRMERYLIDQKQMNSPSLKILEINEKHPIIQKLVRDLGDTEGSPETEDIAFLIFDQACILEGEPIHNPTLFANRLNKYLSIAYAV